MNPLLKDSGTSRDASLERLLRSAVQAEDPTPIEMPFGFDTRVVALWRGSGNGTVRGLTKLLRRVALTAGAVIIFAGAGAYLELADNPDPFGNEFAIADTVIQDEVGP